MAHSQHIIVAARASALSLVQVQEVFSALPTVDYELLKMASFGDKNKHIPLLNNCVADDFFTRELDHALLYGSADVAIHSAKDVPYPLPAGLELLALTAAADQSDSLVSRHNLTLETLPAGAKIGTSSAQRKAEVLALRPDLEIVPIRGTIEERIAQVDSGEVDALIVATCALFRLGLEHRIAQILPCKTHSLQGNLAVVGRANSPFKVLFSAIDIRKTYGTVTLVGFGPGNPDLLTLGGEKALAAADVIFHDDLIDSDFLQTYDAETIYVGKRKGQHSHAQNDINEVLYNAARQGKNVVRLKGGDPMVFAHGREEIDFLQSRFVEVRVIPGVSSGIAMSSYTHIPLTHRGVASSVAFVSGHSPETAQTPTADTLVYYMAGTHLAHIVAKLIPAGRSPETPAALVHNVSLAGQKTFFSTLGELQYALLKNTTPVLLTVGEVVNFENKQMQHILVTGTHPEDYTGAGIITHTPLISIEKIEHSALAEILKIEIDTFDWVIFTSRYGVQFFFEEYEKTKFPLRRIGVKEIASVGRTTTAELHKHSIYHLMQSPTESAEGIVDFFKEYNCTGQKILLPRSQKGLKFLSSELQKLGNTVIDVPIYNNKPNENAETVDLQKFSKIVFSSPSGVDAFVQKYGELPAKTLLVAKGKTTFERLQTEIQ
ncbi:MAG: uroporphyrinogen-III C-methyltransferase [Bacteroidales bacterium]|jgi:uroporphyrinogen III methyltransferase/synthase|nr:uroporphyrinogen-III C-methyltransferase [Bacteroidales bacterium]